MRAATRPSGPVAPVSSHVGSVLVLPRSYGQIVGARVDPGKGEGYVDFKDAKMAAKAAMHIEERACASRVAPTRRRARVMRSQSARRTRQAGARA